MYFEYIFFIIYIYFLFKYIYLAHYFLCVVARNKSKTLNFIYFFVKPNAHAYIYIGIYLFNKKFIYKCTHYVDDADDAGKSI